MIHVALNLVYLVPGETGGTETVARELLPRLAVRNDLRVTALVNREAAGAPGPWHDVPSVTVPVHARNRVEWVRGEQQHVPRIARRVGADLVHSLANTSPVWGRFKRVVTIHDLHYRVVPEAHFGLLGLGMRVLVPSAARSAHRVLAVSEATKGDIVSLLGIAPGKVDVVPNGVSAPAVAPTPEQELRARLGLGDRRVLLTVSAKRPHKNLLRLLDALAQVAADRRPLAVMPGYPTPHEADLRARAQALGVDAIFPAWVSAEDLEGLYALAAAFVFPSLYEGFGLPVLEAMARGVPVATSNRASLPEVASDAALLFDPEDPRAIREAVERLLAEAAARLREAGRARAASFTWDRTAELTAAAYARA